MLGMAPNGEFLKIQKSATNAPNQRVKFRELIDTNFRSDQFRLQSALLTCRT